MPKPTHKQPVKQPRVIKMTAIQFCLWKSVTDGTNCIIKYEFEESNTKLTFSG